MSAEDILRSNEALALDNHQIISTVTEKNIKGGSLRGKKSFSAIVFVTFLLAVFVILFSSGNLIPSAISDILIEETDVQYADAVQSKTVVFQQALRDGNVPVNTIEKLRDNGVIVGYVDGEFKEGDGTQPDSCIKFEGHIIHADDFLREINSNAKLYDAFNRATYSRAAYYYDEPAKEVFNKLGTSRNNYNDDSSFSETMDKIMGSGSNIDISNVSLEQETRQNENNEEEVYYTYKTTGNINSSSSTADELVEAVRSKTLASTTDQATLDAANSLNVADTMSKEQRSSLFFLAFMENISKMKAGLGSESKINEAMNYLYQSEEVNIVDTKTGEIVTVKGSMLEAPSLYAILSGERVNTNTTENYASGRILETIKNQLGLGDSNNLSSEIVASSTKGNRGTIGQYISNSNEGASGDLLSKITTTISSSLINNSFYDIRGVSGGEFLVEGAVNVGKELAKASGATAGDSNSVKSYARLTNSVLAMDAEVDRASRSPFDITSKNTFLGSLLRKFAMGVSRKNSFMKNLSSLGQTTVSAVRNILPTAMADDEVNNYLTVFGNCAALNDIGAVGSATCSMIATFDTSTIDGIFSDSGFISFLDNNTELNSSGTRVIKEGSDLANFILYNDERITPVGVVDGGILSSVSNSTNSVLFGSDILSMVKSLINSSSTAKDTASGKVFVNSSSNSDWSKYKYAQRYVSLARATAALRMYDGDKTAYSKMKYFEGTENPVVAFLNNYYNIASNN